MVDEKKDKILEAAINAFVRYGYRRVTMGDLAREAQMSRPALYLVFCNKEEIFKAALLRFTQRAVEEIRAGIPNLTSLEERLRFAFDVWTVRPFELIQKSPDAKELTEYSHGFARETLDEGYREFETVLTTIIEPNADALARHNLTPQRVAHVAAMAARGYKESARDTDDLRELIAGLLSIVLAAMQ